MRDLSENYPWNLNIFYSLKNLKKIFTKFLEFFEKKFAFNFLRLKDNLNFMGNSLLNLALSTFDFQLSRFFIDT